jgi:hypothetical protein
MDIIKDNFMNILVGRIQGCFDLKSHKTKPVTCPHHLVSYNKRIFSFLSKYFNLIYLTLQLPKGCSFLGRKPAKFKY